MIYCKVLENRAKTGAPFISTYKYFDFHFILKKAGFFLEGGAIEPNAPLQLRHCVLPNISRSKDNQTMAFGLILEYNMRNIFSWKIINKMWWRNYSQTLFQKIKIGNISGSIFESFIKFVVIICQFEGYRNILNLSCRLLAFT